MKTFYTTPYTTQRLVQVAGKSDYANNSSGVGCLIQQDEQVNAINNMQFGQGYKLFVEMNKDLQVTDRVIINGEHYDVKGIKTTGMGSLAFKTCLLSKKKL